MSMDTAPKPGSSLPDDSDFGDEADGEEKDQLTIEFNAASTRMRTLAERTDADTLLYLYARYKQATDGRCSIPKPGMFDFRGKQKWEAWKALGEMTREQSMTEYVDKIKQLDPTWNHFVDETAGRKSKEKSGFGVGVSRPVIEENEGGGSVWLNSVKDGDLDTLKKLLAKNSLLAKEIDENSMTALHWASDRGHLPTVEWLIKEAKIDVNAQDASGQTPLHYAYACGHQTVIAALLTAGADKSILDFDQNRPEDLA